MPPPKIPQVPVTSWSELLATIHSRSVIPKVENQGGHYRSAYVFRGMSCSEWPIATSLERLKSPPRDVEPALLRSFRKYAPRGTFASHSDWEALAVAQHNGLPTRLLDWSVSPLVAVHFATCERQYFSQPGVVWCVDVLALRDRVLPAAIADPIIQLPAVVFDVATLEGAFPKLEHFDRTRAALGDACVFFEPPSLDARIANQTGILSAMNGPDVSPQQYFEKLALANPNRRDVFGIVLDKSAKPEIRDMLDQNNIHERMLFPGLPGLCDWLKRYYGPSA